MKYLIEIAKECGGGITQPLGPGYSYIISFTQEGLQAFAARIRNEALEEAAVIAEDYNNYESSKGIRLSIAIAIRAMKEE